MSPREVGDRLLDILDAITRIERPHFAITRAPKVEKVEDRFGKPCANPMACQWALADETPLNRRILANGVGSYRTADQAPEWLREFNRRFPD